MDFVTDRRRFLQLAGTGATVSLAGCNALQGGDGQPAADTDDGPEGTATVTLAVAIDQEAMRQRQMELQEKLQNGTINQTEAQQQLRAIQTELVGDAIETFRERADGDDSLTIDDTEEQLGILLVSGSPASLIDTLSDDVVRGLLPETTFEEAKAQSQSQPGGS